MAVVAVPCSTNAFDPVPCATQLAPSAAGSPHADMVITVVMVFLFLSLVVFVLRYDYSTAMDPLTVVAYMYRLRLYVRMHMVKAFGQDDFFMSIAVVRAISVRSGRSARNNEPWSILTSAKIFAAAQTIAIIFYARLGSPSGLLGMTSAAMKVSIINSNTHL
jgi:hypothetical protein